MAKKKNKRRPPRPDAERAEGPRQRPDQLAGQTCPECGSAVGLRQIENFPVPVKDCQVDYHLKFCNYCGWNEGRLNIHSNRELSQAELEQIQASLQGRLQLELAHHDEYQQKLATMPFGLAYSVIGAALGFDGAELSMVNQVARGVSPDIAYREICVTLAADPMAPLVFQSLAEEAGGAVLVESWQFWKNLGYPPPWQDVVKGFLKGKNG